MAIQRSNPRFRTHKTAHIVLDGGENLVKCSIRNLSDVGAMLAIPAGQIVPKAFDLLFQNEERVPVIEGVWRNDKKMIIRTCDRVWNNGSAVGVKFV